MTTALITSSDAQGPSPAGNAARQARAASGNHAKRPLALGGNRVPVLLRAAPRSLPPLSHQAGPFPAQRAGMCRIGVVVALATTLVAIAPTPAWADGDEGTTRAYDFVRQAIALIVNTPEDNSAITDKISDAIDAEDSVGVQIGLVHQARQALTNGDRHRARALLEQSIGARVHSSTTDPVPIGRPAPVTGRDTGTIIPVDAMAGRGALGVGDWALLALVTVVGLGGVALSLRLRPCHLPHPDPRRD